MYSIFRGSSAVERSPVKRLVVGSIPTPGAPRIEIQAVSLAVAFRGKQCLGR